MWALHKLKENKRKRKGSSDRESSSSDRVPDLDDLSSPPRDLGSVDGHDPVTVLASPDVTKAENGPWGFSKEDLERFPALRKRNFWCIQRHQARALHYDLRMQLDGSTVSWAIPRGLLGMSKKAEKNRLAVETTLHPISYTVHEGADGTSERDCLLDTSSTLRLAKHSPMAKDAVHQVLWDIGSYTIDYPHVTDQESESDHEQRRKRRKRHGRDDEESEDPLGKWEEDKFRLAFHRPVPIRKSKSIHFTLKGGRKLDNHSYILVLSPSNVMGNNYFRTGKTKTTCFIGLPRGIEGYSWGEGGEEGEQYGRSVKTDRTLRQVCAAPATHSMRWPNEVADLVRKMVGSEALAMARP